MIRGPESLLSQVCISNHIFILILINSSVKSIQSFRKRSIYSPGVLCSCLFLSFSSAETGIHLLRPVSRGPGLPSQAQAAGCAPLGHFSPGAGVASQPAFESVHHDALSGLPQGRVQSLAVITGHRTTDTQERLRV